MTKLALPVGKADQKNRGWIVGAGRHSGIDYGWYNADPVGSQRVYAAAAGRVASVYNAGGWNDGWGCRVIIEHAPGVRTTYNHFWANGIKVAAGQTISAGTYLGQMGATGDSGGTHLHFELYLDGIRVDPQPYYSKDLPGTSPDMYPDQRQSANTVPNIRALPTTGSPDVGNLKPNTIYTMKFYFIGEKVNGTDIWYSDTGARWFHASSFTQVLTTGLEPFAFPEPAPVEPVPVEPVPVEPVPVEPAPVEPAPVEPAPVEPAPVEPAPVEPAPVEPNWSWWAGLVSLLVSLLAAIRSTPKP
jgi:murein DD-endopeptidase MepM/ murein hydrolase activator NlpD